MKKRFLPFTFFLSLAALTVILTAYKPFNNIERDAVKKNNSMQDVVSANSYLQLLRNNKTTGLLNRQAVIKARQETEAIRNLKSTNVIDWNIMGPDNVGGRTRAIIYDNQDASGNTVYAGAVTGGLWKSTDNGITWSKINTANQNLFVSCMTQTEDGTIYVGTGESFKSQVFSQLGQLGYSTGFMGSGLYKSSDGDSFEVIASTQPQSNTPSLDWAFINRVQVDANGRIYAATNTGLKYSDDNGLSWLTAMDTAGNELVQNCYDVKTAGTFVVAAVDNQCFTSSGDAAQFVNHSTGLENQLPTNAKVTRIEFAIAPSDNNVVYASLINETGYSKGVYQSQDAGETWNVVLPETNSVLIFFGAGEFFNTIAVFPDNPDKVLLGGIDLWVGYKTDNKGLFFWEQKSRTYEIPNDPNANILSTGNQVYAFRPGQPSQLMVGTNGGVFKAQFQGDVFTSQPANRKYYTTQIYRAAASGIENYIIGGAQSNGVLMMTGESNSQGYSTQLYFDNAFGGDAAISLINPDVIVYEGAGGRVYRSEDRGKTVSNQFLTSAIGNDNAYITPVALWESFNNENSRDSVWYFAREDIAAGSVITVRSANSGYPFQYTLPEDVSMQNGDSIQVVDPISSRFFIAVNGGVYMTKELHNFGKTPEWFEIANGSVGFTGQPNAIAYSADGNHLWVGTTDGKIYRISNLALAYNKALADINESTSIVANSMFQIDNPETGNPIDQSVTSISVDPQDPTRVLVTFGNFENSNYVFFTDNALDGEPTFVSKQGNLPLMPVYASVIEMSDGNRVIIGTENGVFMTGDISSASPVWTANNDEMGSVPVFDLQQQNVAQKAVTLTVIAGLDTSDVFYPGATNYGIIYGATFGRGIFKSSTYRKPVGIGEIYTNHGVSGKGALKVYPNPVANIVYFDIENQSGSTAEISVYNMNGKRVIMNRVSLTTGKNKGKLDVSSLPTGTYIVKVKNGKNVSTQKFVKL
ncbi:MAG: hypothetical protein DRJ09_06575 [Bacteroidetes bacterium]|nr:MAG: hypothetical protein DRJ09_06575 [Bacteroidota bacterium]